MAFAAGERITGARLNRLQPVQYYDLITASLTKTTTTFEDIPGCSVTFTTTADNAAYSVVAVFDCAVGTVSATTDMVGRIVTDGVAETQTARHQMDNLDRDTVSTLALGTLASAGSHTIKLQGALTVAAGSGTFQIFTGMVITIAEVA